MATLEGQIGGMFGGLAAASNVVGWVLIVGLIAVIGWLVMEYSKYKIKFRILILTKDRTLEVDDRLKKIVKKGSPTRWKLLRRREEIPPPPSEAFRISNRGKFSLTAFYTEHGEYKYVTENLKESAKFASLDAITTEDRAFYEQNYEASKKWQHKDWTDIAREMIPYVVIFLIFVVFLAFWGKTVAPTLELGSKMISLAEVLTDVIGEAQEVTIA